MIESSASTSVVNVSRLIDDGPLTRFMDWSRLDPSNSRLVRVRDSSRCARRGAARLTASARSFRPGSAGRSVWGRAAVLVDGDLERGTVPPSSTLIGTGTV